jgi:GNAT superfamily N-acetyltransferase
MPTPTIRPAREQDLAAAAAIYVENEIASAARGHPLSGRGKLDPGTETPLAIVDLELLWQENPSQVWVAEQDGRIVGMAAAAFRGHHWHLTYLFVTPACHVQGIGGALLAHIHQAGLAAGCTLFTLHASDDPRALTRYYRLGLAPAPPFAGWSATEPRFPQATPADTLEPVLLRLDDPATLNTVDDIDKAVRGIRRGADIRRWLGAGAQGSLLIDRISGAPAGYFLVAAQGDESRIGPVAAIAESRFAETLVQALIAASALHHGGLRWLLLLPGENRAAVPPLLEAGFRPHLLMPFLTSAPVGRFDRYIAHDLDLI